MDVQIITHLIAGVAIVELPGELKEGMLTEIVDGQMAQHHTKLVLDFSTNDTLLSPQIVAELGLEQFKIQSRPGGKLVLLDTTYELGFALEAHGVNQNYTICNSLDTAVASFQTRPLAPERWGGPGVQGY